MTFCSSASLSIITMALFLSALAIVKLFLCRMPFIWLMLYWYLLCSGRCMFVVNICFILVEAMCLSVLCIFGSSCLMAFSVSIIRLLMYLFGSFSSAQLGPPARAWLCSLVNAMFVKFINLGWVFVFLLLWCMVWFCLVSLSNFCLSFCTECPSYRLVYDLYSLVYVAIHCYIGLHTLSVFGTVVCLDSAFYSTKLWLLG